MYLRQMLFQACRQRVVAAPQQRQAPHVKAPQRRLGQRRLQAGGEGRASLEGRRMRGRRWRLEGRRRDACTGGKRGK